MIRPTFPEYVDSTMRAAFVSCKRKYFNEFILNRRSGAGNVHLVAGGAFAAGCEAVRKAYYGKGFSAEDALFEGHKALIAKYAEPERFADHNKSLPNMMGALDAFFQHWGLAADHYQPYRQSNGEPAIEFSFSIPLSGTAHPVTGLPILYCGRFDWVGQHENTGELYAVDEKTTSQLGATWPNQWKHRAQLTGYVWAARQFDLDLSGAVIRGISILKKGYGHAESLQLRSNFYIERWHNQLLRDVAEMIKCYNEGYFDFDFGEACTSYSTPCAYTDSCGSSRPEDYVKANFEHVRWNPILHVVEELDHEDNVIGVMS
jgi:hypothetical protein